MRQEADVNFNSVLAWATAVAQTYSRHHFSREVRENALEQLSLIDPSGSLFCPETLLKLIVNKYDWATPVARTSTVVTSSVNFCRSLPKKPRIETTQDSETLMKWLEVLSSENEASNDDEEEDAIQKSEHDTASEQDALESGSYPGSAIISKRISMLEKTKHHVEEDET